MAGFQHVMPVSDWFEFLIFFIFLSGHCKTTMSGCRQQKNTVFFFFFFFFFFLISGDEGNPAKRIFPARLLCGDV